MIKNKINKFIKNKLQYKLQHKFTKRQRLFACWFMIGFSIV